MVYFFNRFNYFLAILLLFSSCHDSKSKNILSNNLVDFQSFHLEETIENIVSYTLQETVTCGFLDDRGILWFGTNCEGVYRFDGKAFTNYTIENGLCSNKVSSICGDKEGNLWLGTAAGLCLLQNQSFSFIPIPQRDTSSIWLDKVYPIVNPNEVKSVLIDKKGNLWIGTNGAGVYHYDGERFISFLEDIGATYEDSHKHNIVLSISEDLKGNLWFTSLSHGGVSCYDGTAFSQFLPKDGLSDDMYRISYVDCKGNVWFGSNGNRKGGLDRFDGKSFTYYNEEVGLCQKNIMSIYEDNNGNLWLGSGYGGICIYDGATFSAFAKEDGQPFSSILFIIEDANQNIWFGGGYGSLYRFDGDKLIDFTLKKRT